MKYELTDLHLFLPIHHQLNHPLGLFPSLLPMVLRSQFLFGFLLLTHLHAHIKVVDFFAEE